MRDALGDKKEERKEKPDHFYRNTILFAIGLFSTLILGLYFGEIQPLQEESDKMIADNESKSKAEYNSILHMNCKDLGDWLLKDSWFSRDNLIYAQHHYLVNCK